MSVKKLYGSLFKNDSKVFKDRLKGFSTPPIDRVGTNDIQTDRVQADQGPDRQGRYRYAPNRQGPHK